jgi:tetratricopeptide (TPR) repeat protein
VYRNLGVAWSHRKSGNSLDKATAQMELAVSLPHKYPLHFTELDEMYQAAGAAPEKRLALLQDNRSVVAQRDDSLAREIDLLVAVGKFDEAIGLLDGKEFSVWEGGSLSVADDWADAHILRGRQKLQASQPQQALADFNAAVEIPANLPSDEKVDREPEADYWIGKAYMALGDREQAKQLWQKSAAAMIPVPPPAHDDPGRMGQRTIQACYQALALRELGQEDEATARFRKLIEDSNRAVQQQPAQFNSDASVQNLLLERSQLATAHYVASLSYLGLDEKQKAKRELNLALQAEPGFPVARFDLAQLK